MAKIFNKNLYEIIRIGVESHCTGFTTVVVYDIDEDKFDVSKYSTGEIEPVENHLVNVFSLESSFNVDDYCTECYPWEDWDNATDDEKIDKFIDDEYVTILEDFDGFKETIYESLNYIMGHVLNDEIDNLINIKTSQLEGTPKYNDWFYNGQHIYPSDLIDRVCEGIDIENFNEFSEISPRDWLKFEYNHLEIKNKLINN